MYYMRDGIGGRVGSIAAATFTILCIFASFMMGGVMQSDTAVSCLSAVFGGAPVVYSAVLSVLCAIVLFGGVRAVSGATVRLVPLMSALYIAMCLGVIFVCRASLPSALYRIVSEAVTPLSACGGIGGFFASVAVRAGVSRGLLSNEAGCGTAPMAHVTARGDGVRQGRMGMIEVLFDTVVICTLTALAILVTGVDRGTGTETANGMLLPLRAFSAVYGNAAAYLLAIAVLFFSFATVICWGYYGEQCLVYLTRRAWMLALYRILFALSVFLGAAIASSLIWVATDVILGVMTLLNVLSLLVLARAVRQHEKCAVSICHTDKKMCPDD